MIDIIGKRYWLFLISGVFILLSIVFLVVFGLKPGLEFSSGSMLTVSFEQKVDPSALKEEMANLGYGNSIVQTTGGGDFLIRTVALTDEAKKQLEENLTTKLGPLTEKSFENIEPTIAKQTSRTTLIAVIIAAVGILLYMVWAFRRLPKALSFGTSAIIALLHDVLITAGIFSLLGAILNWEINLMFITGILAILGYSVNNTVVVFDRIRENMKKSISPSFEAVANYSVVETMGRCLNTNLTTLITILALLLFVGGAIQNFVVVLLIGVIVGTFDSICIAPSLLVVWEQGEWGRFIGRKPHPTRV
jgi:preprotein translocase subunit SecF